MRKHRVLCYGPPQKHLRAFLKAFGEKIQFFVSKLMPDGKSRFEGETNTTVIGIRGTDGVVVMKNPTQAICLSGEIYVHGLEWTQEVISSLSDDYHRSR